MPHLKVSKDCVNTFIGPLLELLVVGGLLHQLQDLLRQLGISKWISFRVHFLRLAKYKLQIFFASHAYLNSIQYTK